MNLEADQAVQEARFAGACQDQHAGRPAPNLGWPGERKSTVQQAETSVVSRSLGPAAPFVVLKKSPDGAGEGVGDG